MIDNNKIIEINLEGFKKINLEEIIMIIISLMEEKIINIFLLKIINRGKKDHKIIIIIFNKMIDQIIIIKEIKKEIKIMIIKKIICKEKIIIK